MADSRQRESTVRTFDEMFPRESDLRDHLATHLHLIENGLKLVAKEFAVVSQHGAGGSIDILASDSVGHFVVIELKKSDATARAALHELTKYITLLKQQEGIGRDELRCVIVSSHWHELLEPFSYFHAVADVQVDGYHAVVDPNGSLSCHQVSPKPVMNLPTFSPEFDLFTYDSQAERNQHWELISSRALNIAFVRAAMCLLDPRNATETSGDYRSIVIIWRIDDAHYDDIERICGFKIGHLAPYAFNGWEPECDVLYWLASADTELGFPGSAELQRGTAEKVTSILDRFAPVDLRHCGRNVKRKTLNDIDRVISLLCGYGSRLPIGRHNPVNFHETVGLANSKTLEIVKEAFLKFIGFVPFWHDTAKAFLDYAKQIENVQFVELKAMDKKHFFYAAYQATVHPETGISHFSVMLRDRENRLIGGIIGWWSWDGTCPQSAKDAIDKLYGNSTWAILSLFSAVDDRRYDDALNLHGFHPIVVFVEMTSEGRIGVVDVQPDLGDGWTSIGENPLRRFVEMQPEYAAQLVRVFEGIPTEPGDGAVIIGVSGNAENDA